ncbi:MAG: LysR family transcriptional regulator [Gammaproteobacteria bacterium]|jgi:DNA-binding transcriptional LysR family regulator|nr:LysR family transcriptional regulator [Gammaproteobacteria bacterium]MBT4493327.1 LysR family transcriptional regulator [Gammaproteobacteria bacterium]
MKLSDIDLNLFVVFDAIYTEGNLTRAGEIIGITQPAVSNSLSRLRNLFDDPLFVRTAEGMVPTPVAQNIIGSVRQALGLIRSSVQESESFDPAVSDKRFRVSMTDLSQAILLPRLFKQVRKEAPMVSIDCYQVHRRDLNIELASGNLDLAIDIPLTPDPQVKQLPLYSHPYVCVVNENNDTVGDKLDVDAYLSLQHIHITSRRGGLGHVDLALGKMGKKRDVALRTQHYLSTPQLVATTDFALTVPKIFAEFLENTVSIRYLELPFEVPHLESHLYWHESTDRDQANIWIRNLISQAYQST